MAGMFYSLTEAAEKLGRTEDEVKQLAKEGTLREFRDGSNLLFKIEEVDALLTGGVDLEAVDLDAELEAAAPEEALAESAEPELEAEPTAEPPLEEDVFGLEEAAGDLEPAEEATSDFELTEEELPEPAPAEMAAEQEAPELEPVGEAEGTSELGFAPDVAETTGEEEALVLDEEETPVEAALDETEEEIFLAPESGILGAESDMLGGILDEIYTAEGGEEGTPGDESGTVDDLTTEAEHVVPEEGLAVPEPVAMAMGPAIGPTAYIEAPPDTQSNMLGMLLFLPLAALLYTTIVTVAAQKQVMPSILESVQGLVWYIMGGAVVVAALVIGASFAMGGEKTRAPKAKKAKKGKKERAPKEKKAKAPKPKKEKKPKPAKPKKAKKPFLGKKKGK